VWVWAGEVWVEGVRRLRVGGSKVGVGEEGMSAVLPKEGGGESTLHKKKRRESSRGKGKRVVKNKSVVNMNLWGWHKNGDGK